ncbi:hypothetical protein ACFHYQ_12845 [Sphaerimonospora cavernae]|uniref:Tetratricopeptide repeat protein n=1 Tax=Sphaerimonospora cavernae TaxID=1740611 RepID=A0ABV6U5A2_9ACTN
MPRRGADPVIAGCDAAPDIQAPQGELFQPALNQVRGEAGELPVRAAGEARAGDAQRQRQAAAQSDELGGGLAFRFDALRPEDRRQHVMRLLRLQRSEIERRGPRPRLDRDGRLAEAWALRGELGYAAGDLAAAASDLDRAVELGGTPEMRFNRAVVRQEAGRYADAAADYEIVLAATGEEDCRERLDFCLTALRGQDRADLTA